MTRALSWLATVAIVLSACTTPDNSSSVGQPDAESSSIEQPPAWAQQAIWYQIFVERFRNGDPSNDPTLHDIEGSWPPEKPANWRPTAWTHDWFAQEDWAREMGEAFYYTVQLRRYGGDLQGVIDKLDYLQDLGVNALYLNPINDAPSLHKFDARSYHHIDRNFGPDPVGDEATIAGEDPSDSETWHWTAADRLFLRLVEEAHLRGMKIIVDFSWNHTGVTFWAWRDILEKQAASPYADWYRIQRFDKPDTPENEFSYRGWNGVAQLPEWKKTGVADDYHGGPVEGNLHPEVISHVFAVTRRWMDPDGDDDPSDGIDGFRLDVAEMVPLGFWRDYRQFVKSINPEAYLVGEVWWEKWPDRMFNPRPYLDGVFDAVMNYHWYLPTRGFFSDAPPSLTPGQYVAHLDSIERGIPESQVRSMMNLTASHDSPRFATSIYNPGPYKYGVNPRDNLDYKLGQPDASTLPIRKQILVLQFTYTGAPHIWNGDEVGMWGADDPDNRKPLLWADLSYEPERADPLKRERNTDIVAADLNLLDFYRKLAELRNSHIELFSSGSLDYVLVDDERGLLGYLRRREEQQVLVLFNVSSQPHEIVLPLDDAGAWEPILETVGGSYRVVSDTLFAVLPSRQAAVLISH